MELLFDATTQPGTRSLVSVLVSDRQTDKVRQKIQDNLLIELPLHRITRQYYRFTRLWTLLPTPYGQLLSLLRQLFILQQFSVTADKLNVVRVLMLEA